MAHMIVAGEALNVVVEGDATKPPLMISDPLAMTHRVWDRQMPALLEHFRVVRYDSRGHGESIADEGPYSIDGLANDALAILDTLGIEKAHWLGLSKGAMVGLYILAHAKGRIGRAVLANTSARVGGPDLWNSRIQAARATDMAAVAATVAERWFTPRFRDERADEVERVLAMVRATPLQGYLATCAALRDMDLREAMRGIDTPVLVIVGRHDPSTPPETGRAIATAIEGATLVTLDTSHVSNVEDPENFSRAVVDFLTAVEPARTAPALGSPP
jgi:3-oxoadipate enol-lactonase